MAFFDKLNELTNTVKDKTSDVIETGKLNAKINSEKSAVGDLLKRIGEVYYKKHAAGEPTDAEIADLLANIDTHNAVIKEVEEQIKALKDKPEAMEPSAMAQQKVCPSCGANVGAGIKFCNECGTKME